MNGEIQTVIRPRFYRLKLIWKVVRLAALGVYWFFAAILCLYGIALIALDVAMIILPLIAWHRGEPWGDGTLHPLCVSAIAAFVLFAMVGINYAFDKVKAKAASRLGRQAPAAETRPTRLAA